MIRIGHLAVLLATALVISSAQAQPIPAPRDGEPPELPGTAERGPAVEGGAPDRAEREERPTARPAEPLVTPESQGDADPCAGDAACYQRRDLQAQQDMADAAFWMTVATWVQVGVAVVGTIVVLIALYYSREAIRAATKGNELTRGNLIAQERAWIKIESIKIVSPLEWNGTDIAATGNITVEIFIRNIGKTPAFRVWPNIEAMAGLFTESIAAKARETKRFNFGFALFPDDPLTIVQKVTVYKRIGIHVTADGPIESPMSHLLLACCVTYDLAFDKERRQTGHAFIYWRPGVHELARSIGPQEGVVIPEMELHRMTGFGNDTFAD
jgi:hypothetical protein